MCTVYVAYAVHMYLWYSTGLRKPPWALPSALGLITTVSTPSLPTPPRPRVRQACYSPCATPTTLPKCFSHLPTPFPSACPPPLCSLIILPLPRLDDGDERKRPSHCENNQGREAQEGKEEEEEPLQFCMPERSPLILSFPSASPPPRNRVAISPTGLDSPSPLLNSETVRRRSREWS